MKKTREATSTKVDRKSAGAFVVVVLVSVTMLSAVARVGAASSKRAANSALTKNAFLQRTMSGQSSSTTSAVSDAEIRFCRLCVDACLFVRLFVCLLACLFACVCICVCSFRTVVRE